MATLPMTAVMLAGRRFGRHTALPPERIVKGTSGSARVPGSLDRATEDAVWPGAHLAIGVVFGVIYSLLQTRLPRPIDPLTGGLLFGLAEWFVSYQGVAPALDLMPPASRDDRSRQATNVAAHLVYGAVVGLLVGDRRGRGGPRPRRLSLPGA